MRGGLLLFGVVCIVLGGLWTLQGIGIVGGSFMTGQSLWATIGGALLLVGLLLCAYAARRPLPPH
jgi:hypothetical protein